MRFARVGSVLYVLWGVLHLSAVYEQFSLASTLDPGILQGKLNQSAWNLLYFALASILIAATLNWRNSVLGYWLNLAIVSVADIGFLIFVFLPGYAPAIPGLFGPALWIAAAILTTAGMRAKKKV